MTAEIVVVGAGGFGREVLDVIEAMNAVQPTWTVLGVADGSPRPADVERLQRRGIRLLGADDKVLADCSPTHFVVGIGSPAIRREVAEKFESHGWMPATVAHPSATTGADVELGGGTVICAGVRLTTNVRLGRHCHVNLNSTVGHDAVVGDFVTVNPLASISGEVSLGSGTSVGAGAVIINQITVGKDVTIGASACVVRDVPDGALVKGVPAR